MYKCTDAISLLHKVTFPKNKFPRKLCIYGEIFESKFYFSVKNCNVIYIYVYNKCTDAISLLHKVTFLNFFLKARIYPQQRVAPLLHFLRKRRRELQPANYTNYPILIRPNPSFLSPTSELSPFLSRLYTSIYLQRRLIVGLLGISNYLNNFGSSPKQQC